MGIGRCLFRGLAAPHSAERAPQGWLWSAGYAGAWL